jgi:alanine-glyoxylate transaminase/(R)-3-amino-2-methylpropionate-pyruvate transaminase
MNQARAPASVGNPASEAEYEAVAERRRRYLSPALGTFTAFEEPLLLTRGQGAYVWDASGRRYLDCLAQNLCISVGYGHPRVDAAVLGQMRQIQHVTTMYYHPAPAYLAEELVARFPAGYDWVVHPVNSGAEAIDLATLVARACTGNHEILSLRNAYHGLHFGGMAASGLALCRQPVPAAPGYVHVHNPDPVRGAYGDDVDAYVDDIRRVIDSSTPGVVAGILIEPIQGYGGVLPMPPGYLRRAVELVRAAGGLFICDEVQTGFGRTGAGWWAFEQEGVVPDVVVVAKGLGNGFPIAAMVARRDVAESMARRKFFNTYGANPMACAAARARAARDRRRGAGRQCAARRRALRCRAGARRAIQPGQAGGTRARTDARHRVHARRSPPRARRCARRARPGGAARAGRDRRPLRAIRERAAHQPAAVRRRRCGRAVRSCAGRSARRLVVGHAAPVHGCRRPCLHPLSRGASS